MLLWLIIAISFVACVAAYHMWQGITWQESLVLLVSSSIVFAFHLHYIYKIATTDTYLVTGYVTSLIHRPPFSYSCGKNRTCHEQERWLIEQRPQPAARTVTLQRSIHSGDGEEFCTGDCQKIYPAPYSDRKCCSEGAYFHTIDVSLKKFQRTSLGDVSVALKSYFNPVQASDDVIYNNEETKKIPYFTLTDSNKVNRLISPEVAEEHLHKIEKLNQTYSGQNISLGLIVTKDPLYFEKLKRSWHQGKANDFVIVITSLDDQHISNVNVLGWNNYNLKENISSALMGAQTLDFDITLDTIEKILKSSPPYTMMNFSNYEYLNVKIPDSYYAKILIFQTALFFYILTLLRLNPNTKTYKLPMSQVLQMWNKHFRPPDKNWHLHPFTPSGLLLYIAVPAVVVNMLWTL